MSTISSHWKITRLASALVGLVLLASTPLTAAVEIGAPLPPLAEYGLTEGKLPDLTGKVVIIDFWASWCGPCMLSFPALQEIQKQYKDSPVVILAISVDEKSPDMAKFLKKIKFSPEFSVLRDAEHRTVNAFQPANMPSSYVFDKSGKLRFIHAGFHGAKTKEEYIENINLLLKE